MKKSTTIIFLLISILALMLPLSVCADPSDALTGIFDALLAEDSSYSGTKMIYAEYFPETEFEEKLDDDGFTITINNNEYLDGSWRFDRKGDYLTINFPNDDLTGFSMVMYAINAIGMYFDMNTSLLSGYINGLSILEIPNDNFIMEEDEATGTTTVSLNIAGPYDMKELDQMILDESVLDPEPLGEGFFSRTNNIGKIMMIANGSKDDLTMLFGEYGGLDDLVYRSMVNAVLAMKPEGWESFTSDYTSLADAETEGYSVVLDPDGAAVDEIIEDKNEDYVYALIHFGK